MHIKKLQKLIIAVLVLYSGMLQASSEGNVGRRTMSLVGERTAWGLGGLLTGAAMFKCLGNLHEGMAGNIAATYASAATLRLADKIGQNRGALGFFGATLGLCAGAKYLGRITRTETRVIKEKPSSLALLTAAGVGVGASMIAEKIGSASLGQNAFNGIKKLFLAAGSAILAKQFCSWYWPSSDHPLGYDQKKESVDVTYAAGYRDGYGERFGNGNDPLVLNFYGFGGESSSRFTDYFCEPKKYKEFIEKIPKNIRYKEFDFSDACYNGQLQMFARVNLGGERDVRTALWHIYECYKEGYKRLVIFGHSRGGATAIGVAHCFAFPDRYKELWRWLGLVTEREEIAYDEIQKVWEVIDSMFLANPVLDVNKLVFVQSYEELGLGWLAKKVAGIITKIDFSAQQPIEKLEEIINLDKLTYLPMFDISVSAEDKVVGNKDDARLKACCEKAKKENKKIEYCENTDDHMIEVENDIGWEMWKEITIPAHSDIRAPMNRVADYLSKLNKSIEERIEAYDWRKN